MRTALWRTLPALLVALTIGVVPAFAQTEAGRIEGTITDATGGVLPGATVTVKNLSTGVEQRVVSGDGGRYTVTPVRPGNYSVKVTLQGFKEARTDAVAVAVAQVLSLDYSLQLGQVTETVRVTAKAPQIETVTSSIGTVIDSRQVHELPLNGRNFTQLATLTPGVNRGIPGSNAEGSSGNAETFRYGETGGGALSVHGMREQFNNFVLDGVDNNESLVNSTMLFPPIEGIQEFRVTTTNAPAEFGRAGGAVVNVVTKSGTNQYTGSAFYFNRPASLATTPHFVELNHGTKPDFNRQQYGAGAGGPIVKDKLFFFGEYAGLSSRVPVEAGGFVTVPTARMRNGDFSELLNPAFTGLNKPITIYNPNTGVPFTGNIIPPGTLDPVAQRYLNVYPQPTRTDRYQQNYATNRRRDSRFNEATARVDYTMSDNSNLFGRFSLGREYFNDPGRIPGYQAGFGSGRSDNHSYGTALGYNRVLSHAVTNETRVGINKQLYDFLPVSFGTNQDAALGIPGPGGVTQDNGISLIGGGNGNWIEYLGDFGQYVVPQWTYQVSNATTWVKGPHTMKFGATIIRRRLDYTRTRFGKGFYFFSDTTATPGVVPALGATGFEVSDMLLGATQFTATGLPGFIPKGTRSWENSAFVQDDFEVRQNVTLNLGLRYDVFTPYTEVNNELANFDPATGRLVLPGQNGAPAATVDTNWHNFGPRVGVAWRLGDKSVVRVAYGLYYFLQRAGIDNELTQSAPFGTVQFRFSGPGATVRLSDPIPPPIPVDPTSPTLPDGSLVIYTPRNNPTSRAHEYSVSYQRQLTPSTAMMAAYVGNTGQNLTAILTSAGFSGAISERLTTVQNNAHSRYNGMELQLRQTLSHGLSYLASYTLSRATNNAPGPFPGPGGNFAVTPTSSTNLALDQSLADYDRTHYFSFAATYALPFGRNLTGMAQTLGGGWQVNGIVTLASGAPFSVFAGNLRAKQVADPAGPKTVAQWFNTAAFVQASGPNDVGPRNTVRGPSTRTVDVSFFKNFRFLAHQGVEFRLEAFNVFNTPQYDLPGNIVTSGGYGQITTTRINTERQIELALRYTF